MGKNLNGINMSTIIIMPTPSIATQALGALSAIMIVFVAHPEKPFKSFAERWTLQGHEPSALIGLF